MIVKVIEEFNDEKKFAKRVEDFINADSLDLSSVKYAVTTTPKGILYTALVFK